MPKKDKLIHERTEKLCELLLRLKKEQRILNAKIKNLKHDKYRLTTSALTKRKARLEQIKSQQQARIQEIEEGIEGQNFIRHKTRRKESTKETYRKISSQPNTLISIITVFLIIFSSAIINLEDFSGQNHITGFAILGGEVNASAAQHLDEEYILLEDIYSQIQYKDSNWSSSIQEHEYVRVTFEEELTNGSIIDVVVRSNKTVAYFEVYENATNNKVGQSGIVNFPETQYIILTNLSSPQDTFDFKIVKLYQSWDDNTSDIDNETASFLEFDFIHDAPINASHANGTIVYAERNTAFPRYRKWGPQDNDFTSELTDMSDTTSDINWIVTRANHERDEVVVGMLDQAADVFFQVFSQGQGWHNNTRVTADSPNISLRSFDVGIEQLSGDAIIFYEDASSTDGDIAYRTWNGNEISSQTTLNFGSQGVLTFVQAYPKRNNDSIMILAGDSASNLYALVWDGSTLTHSQNLSSTAAQVDKQHFAFAWESESGDGVTMYGSNNDFVLRTYSASLNAWSAEQTQSLGPFQIESVRLCADPTSDYIGAIWQESGTGFHVDMWNGTGTVLPPAHEANGEAHGAYNVNSDCAWFSDNSALFGFIDRNQLAIDYVNFTKPSSWSVPNITFADTTVDFASDDIAGMQFAEHPTTGEIMAIAMDIGEDIAAHRWNGTGWENVTASPLEGTTEPLNGDTQAAMFAWTQYDPPPEIQTINPYWTGVLPDSTIDINTTIIDLNISVVHANITLPNGTIRNVVLSDPQEDTIYNITFTETDLLGQYIVETWANDSTSHGSNYSTRTERFFVNNVPTHSNPLLNASDFPKNTSNANLTAYNQSTTDTNGDQVKNIIDWQLGGESIAILNLPFDGEDSNPTFAQDYTTNQNNITDISGVTFNITGGYDGFGAYEFDGVNDYMQLSDDNSLRINSNITISAWIYLKSTGEDQRIITKQKSSTNVSYSLFVNNANSAVFAIETTSYATANSTTPLAADTWHHLTGTYDGSNVKIYVNGALEDTTSLTGSITYDSEDLSIGYYDSTQGEFFNGTIDEIMLYNRSLSDTQVLLFATNKTNTISSEETKENDVWKVEITPSDGMDTGRDKASGEITINNGLPLAPTLLLLTDGSSTINRTPALAWNISSDTEGDTLTYNLEIDDNPTFNNPEVNVSGITNTTLSNTTYELTTELDVDTTYFWRVRANDSGGYGDFSSAFNFTVDSYLSLTILQSTIDFGSINLGESDNTSDGSPQPFHAENSGNINMNITVTGDQFFNTTSFPSSNFQFNIEANESNAFNTTTSTTTYTNVTNVSSIMDVVDLNWRTIKDDFLTNLNISVPAGEPSGHKGSTITYTIVSNGG